MGGAPDPLVEHFTPVVGETRDGETHHGEVVALTRIAGLFQRRLYLSHILRRVRAGAGVKRLEQRGADDVVPTGAGDIDIGLIDLGDMQIGRQQQIGIGRGLEGARQISV
ncbi:MAG: hypothetical protein A2352_08580 [Caulobacterales bacterium RIFOXYB1_FULL_67_16]|nr:MAG: hypothetical protein A2352_08580 [Caulobacterales bacterium RIFOXYB1_FULL_67_16]